jgi:hypothetical protein
MKMTTPAESDRPLQTVQERDPPDVLQLRQGRSKFISKARPLKQLIEPEVTNEPVLGT